MDSPGLRRLERCLLIPMVCALCVGVTAGQRSEKPVVRTATIPLADRAGLSPFEPHVAVDPEHPERLVVGAMFRGVVGKGDQERGDSRLLTWHSADGGRSWSKPVAPFGDSERPAGRLGSDPVLGFGTGSTCWFSGCDHDWHLIKPNYSAVKVCPSQDGGKTWGPPLVVTELDNDKNGKGIVDKQWLTVDQSGGKRRGTLYVAWSRLDEDQKHCDLRCAALPPGAKQFTPSVRLGEPLDLKSVSDLIHHVQLTVRPDGTLDAVWRFAPTNRLVHASSQDGSKTFSKPLPISDNEKTGLGQLPSLTATPDGNLLVAWGNQGDVLCSVLASGRWSAPDPVAGNLPEGVRLSHPAVAATADALWVLAYRRENKPERVSVVLYRSTDLGKKWEEHCILASRDLSDGKARKFSPGDYVGLAAAKSCVYAAYVLPGEESEGPRPRLYVSTLGVTKER
jgi:hypothetical protein